MSGDVKAAGMVLKVIETRSRLLGLDKANGVQAAQTVVMSPAESAAWKETLESGRHAGQAGDATQPREDVAEGLHEDPFNV